MRPQERSQTGAGSTSPIVMDINGAPFAVGMGVIVSGTVTYTVEHSFDNPFAPGGPVVWFPHASLAAKTANADGNYAFPVRAVRLTVASGTGTATLKLIQAAAGIC